LAQRYVEEHPLTLNLDIDRIRDLIGGWREDPSAAGLLARAVALSAARTHLAAGQDVVIPQFLGRAEFLEQVERLAGQVGAEFHEIVLLDSKDNALSRFAERTRAAADATHLQAHEMLDRAGGGSELAAMYDRLTALVATRPTAKVVPSQMGQPDETYQRFLDALS
jgi:predicted kinase